MPVGRLAGYTTIICLSVKCSSVIIVTCKTQSTIAISGNRHARGSMSCWGWTVAANARKRPRRNITHWRGGMARSCQRRWLRLCRSDAVPL